MLKWLASLHPLQKGFFAFSRGLDAQPTTPFDYFGLAILILRYLNLFSSPTKQIFQAKVQSKFQCDYIKNMYAIK